MKKIYTVISLLRTKLCKFDPDPVEDWVLRNFFFFYQSI